MFNAASLPESIPVFPLPGALLLPRARLPLHIFEPRFLAMLDDVLKTQDRLIGMIQPLSLSGDSEEMHIIGCAGRVVTFSETQDGRYMLTLTGISRYRVLDVIEGFTPYRKCNVVWDEFAADLGAAEQDSDFQRQEFMDLLGRFFATHELTFDWEALRDAEDELLINSLSMLCPLSPEDKQALLEAKTLQKRRETLTTLLEFSLRGGPGEKALQ